MANKKQDRPLENLNMLDEHELANSTSNKVISLDNWKNQQQQNAQELNDYLDLLGFHELLVESSSVIDELNSGPLTNDLNMRSVMVLKELNKRLNSHLTNINVTTSETAEKALKRKN